MTRLKKGLPALLALIVLLMAGCTPAASPNQPGTGKQEPTRQAMGRYVETQADIQSASPRIIRWREGALELYDGKSGLLTSTDGKNLVTQPAPWWPALQQRQGGCALVDDYAYDNKGNVYLLFQDANYNLCLGRFDGQSVTDIIPSDWPKRDPDSTEFDINSYIYVNQLAVTQEGDILLNYPMTDVRRYSPQGQLITQYPGKSRMLLLGQELVVGNTDNTGFISYDLATGSVIRDIAGDPMSDRLTADGEGALYLAGPSGLRRVAPGGSLVETLLEGGMTSMNMPTVELAGLARDGEGKLMALTLDMNSGAAKLLHYAYDAQLPSTPNTELMVYALRDNPVLRQAIGVYQRQHPAVRVNLRTALDEGGGATEADCIRALNTELMAGKGPDVLLLDGLPVDSYQQKGVLADLAEVIAPLLEQGALIQNLIAPYETEGAYYAAPTFFTVPLLIGDAQLTQSAQGLSALAGQSAGEIPLMTASTYQTRLRQFFLGESPLWRDGQGGVDVDKLEAFLENIKRLGDACGDTLEDGQVSVQANYGAFAGGSARSLTGGYQDIAQMALTRSMTLRELENQKCRLVLLLMSMPSSLMTPDTLDQAGLGVTTLNNVYLPRAMLGVNAASPLGQEAREFVATAFSPEVQGAFLMVGLPVRQEALRQMLTKLDNKEAEEMGVVITETNDEGVMGEAVVYKPAGQPLLDSVYNACLQLNTPCTLDTTLLDIVLKEAESFFTGQRSAREAAEAAAGRAASYLAE